MTVVPLPPCPRVTLLGEAESVKFGPGFTFNESVAVLVRPPIVPTMLTVNEPVVALLAAINVRVLEALAGFGLNSAVTPAGSPDADRLTLLLNPFCGVTVTLVVPLPP